MNDTQTGVKDVSAARPLSTDDIHDQGVSWTDVLVAIGEWKFPILGFSFIAAVIGVVVSLLLPPTYVGKTVIIPPQQERSGISALAGLGALAELDSVGLKSPDEMYLGLLRSDTVAGELTSQFKLTEHYNVKLVSQARKILQSKVQITSDKKSGFITIAASDRSPEFAAQLANAYVGELRKLLDRLAVTDAQQRRVFFQQEIDKTLTLLSQAQIVFDQARRKSGVVSIDEQVATSIRASADLKAKISALEVRLQSMRTYATPENPEALQVAAEIEAMRSQLATLEQGEDTAAQMSHSGDDSAAALANIRAYREVRYREAMLDQLRRQLELAQVDEAREGPLVQQIDEAVPPEQRTAPKRTLIVLAAAVAGGMIGICLALIRMGLRSGGQFGIQLARIRLAWRFRRRSE